MFLDKALALTIDYYNGAFELNFYSSVTLFVENCNSR